MQQSSLLSKTNKSIFSQSIEALHIELYDLALVGLVTVFDGALSVATNDTTPQIVKRIDKINDRIENLSDEEWEELNERDIAVFGMYITWTESMKSFQLFSDFSKPESEPEDLNRHWIAHGRKTSKASKLDCCKMINALYGLLYFGNEI